MGPIVVVPGTRTTESRVTGLYLEFQWLSGNKPFQAPIACCFYSFLEPKDFKLTRQMTADVATEGLMARRCDVKKKRRKKKRWPTAVFIMSPDELKK